jgi:hypothetical protein
MVYHTHSRFFFLDYLMYTELSHQQSREIEQHQARHYTSNQRSSGGPDLVAAVMPGLHRTADEFQRFATTVVDACTTAYHESVANTQRQRQYAMLRRQNPATTYLEDFGIPKEHDLDPIHDSLLLHDNGLDTDTNDTTQNNSAAGGAYTAMGPNGDFVEIPRLRRRPGDAEGWGAAANLDLYFSVRSCSALTRMHTFLILNLLFSIPSFSTILSQYMPTFTTVA